MKITKLEKKKHLFQLETDTDQIIYITEDTIVHFFLSKGKTLTEEEFQDIQDFAQYSNGKNLALYYISFKQRTEKEVKTYLKEHDISTPTIIKIIEKLKEENWINDKQYTTTFINQNLRTGDKGPRILKQKLKEKGINSATIEDCLEAADFTELSEKVAKKIEKKYQKKLPVKSLTEKIKQTMYAKGFSTSTINDALKLLNLEKNEEQEIELLYKQIEKNLPKYQKKYEGYKLNQALTNYLTRKGYSYDDIKSALREYL